MKWRGFKTEPWDTPLPSRRAKKAQRDLRSRRQEDLRECRDWEGKGEANTYLCVLEGLAKRWTRIGTQKRSKEELFLF